jgi:hypothetical protein
MRERRFQAALHGHEMEVDGGAPGSGVPSAQDPERALTHDPTQGRGTSAWQRAQKNQLELNARRRRN